MQDLRLSSFDPGSSESSAPGLDPFGLEAAGSGGSGARMAGSRESNAALASPVSVAGAGSGMSDSVCSEGCFEASINVPGTPSQEVVSRLSRYLQDAYGILDALIVDAQDPVQRNRLAHMARSLYKAIDAASVLR